MKRLLILISILSSASIGFCAEYHVAKSNVSCSDSGAGTQAQPWCTVGKANAALLPGDSVTVHKGIYSEQIYPAVSGASAQLQITYKTSNADLATIHGIDGNYYPVYLYDRSHITIDGFIVEHGNTSLLGNDRHGLVYTHGGSGITIKNCTLIGTRGDIVSVWNNGAGLRVAGFDLDGTSDVVVDHNIIRNMTFCGVVIGSGQNIAIKNNLIRSYIQDGIHLGSSVEYLTHRNVLIEGNEITGSYISDGVQADGCGSIVGANTCIGVNGVTVRNNKIYDNAENSIDLKGAGNWLIENNIIGTSYGNNDGGTKPIDTCTAPPCPNNQGGVNIGRGANRYSKNIMIRNNIIYDGNTGILAGDKYSIYGNTIINNRRQYTGHSIDVGCITSSCQRKPSFSGILITGEDVTVRNNIIANNGFSIIKDANKLAKINNNIYSSHIGDNLFVDYKGTWNWDVYSIGSARSTFSYDLNSKLINTSASALFKSVESMPNGSPSKYNFALVSPVRSQIDSTILSDSVGDTIKVFDSKLFYVGDGVLINGKLLTVVSSDVDAKTITVGAPVTVKKGDNIVLKKPLLKYTGADVFGFKHQLF